jgi:hypothetical protein
MTIHPFCCGLETFFMGFQESDSLQIRLPSRPEYGEFDSLEVSIPRSLYEKSTVIRDAFSSWKQLVISEKISQKDFLLFLSLFKTMEEENNDFCFFRKGSIKDFFV